MSCVILLACYQGERFLEAQLDSLLGQSFQNFKILARDDGSTDQTQSILDDYAKRFPDKITVLDSHTRLGVVGNFNALLEQAHADFIFFSDQDDVWEHDKVKRTINEFKFSDPKIPILVHTDLQVVDEHLNVMHPSFWDYTSCNPNQGNLFSRALVQNMATGCTMAFNKALRDLAYPIPQDALMHDWWISLIASACGTTKAIQAQTIRYRQHANNTLGAKAIGWKSGFQKLIQFLKNPDMNTQDAKLREKQAAALYDRLKNRLSQEKMKTLELFLKAPEMHKLKRKWIYLTRGFSRQGLKKMIPYLFQNRPF